MRILIAATLTVALVVSIVACQEEAGEQGPIGPQGPAGEAGPPGSTEDITSADDTAITAIARQLQELSETDLSVTRQEDSDRLDNLIHLIIENTKKPDFKARLEGLDREIPRVFEAAAAAAPDDETVQTFELLEGIVVVSSIMNAIADARLTAADQAMVAVPTPPKYEPGEYTQYFVKEAIRKYQSEGLDATIAHYNTEESIDGQWYMFILDENETMLAHTANPALVGQPASAAVGPNNYPAGEAVVAVADEDGAWFSYSFPNPASGIVEVKHSWMVRYDNLTFGSGWHERGPSKSDAPAYTRSFVERAIDLHNAIGRKDTVAYYNTNESVDGQWYVFIIDEDGYTIGHPNPMFRGRDPNLRVDSTGYFYGDNLLSATESGRWVDYVLLNPETGEERQKNTRGPYATTD